MKKLISKFIPLAIVLGTLWAQITLYILLSEHLPAHICVAINIAVLIPFLLYGAARKLPAGKIRKCCHFIGGIFLCTDCYFMIVTAFIGLLLLFGLPLSLSAYLLAIDLCICLVCFVVGAWHAHHVRTVRYTVSLPNVKNSKIVFFSDLHLGSFCTLQHLKRVCQKISDESPDLVLYGGDLVDMDMPIGKKADAYTKVLATVGGIVGCEGNHDLLDMHSDQRGSFLKKANIRILEDDCIQDAKTHLCIAARKSRKRKRKPIDELFCPQKQILVDHDPKTAKEAVDAGYALVLCGHTHKGQTFPGNWIRRFATPYFYGKYKVDNSTVITTAGCGGASLPLRLFVTNEIAVITIENENENA